MGAPGAVLPSGEDLAFVLFVVFLFLVVVAVGGVHSAKGLARLRRALRIVRSDTAPIWTLPSATGPVEVAGTARERPDDEPVRAPFSGERCLACEYEIVDLDGKYTSTVHEGRVHAPFYVEDDTGSVLVDPAGATFNFEKHERYVGSKTDLTEPLVRFIEEHPRFDVDEGWFSTTRLFVERRLDPDEDVHVYGLPRYDPTVTRRPGSVNAVIEATPAGRSALGRIRTWFTAPPFVISDGRETAAVRRLLIGAAYDLGIGGLVLGMVLYFAWEEYVLYAVGTLY